MKTAKPTVRETLRALVIRETPYGENAKMLTLLTENGLKKVSAHGARGIKGKSLSGVGLFTFSEFILDTRDEQSVVSEASPIESFYGIREDYDKITVASFLTEVVEALSVEGQGDGALLSLTLNTLYLLAGKSPDIPKLKAAFTFRALAVSGFCPDLSGCTACGAENAKTMYLDTANGTLTCEKCFGEEPEVKTGEEYTGVIKALSPDVLAAMRYIVSAPAKRVFLFSLEKEETFALDRVSETYLTEQLGRRFGTLRFYRGGNIG